MAAAIKQDRWIEIPPEMKGPVIFSAIFHVSLVIIALVGLPYFKKTPDPMMNTAIPIEILPIAEKTTTDRPEIKAPPKPPEEIKEKPLVKEKPPAPPKVEAVEPPREITPPKPKTEAKPKPVVPPPPTEKLETPKPEEKPKPDEKPAEEQQQDFTKLLKNLQDSDPQVEEDVPAKKDAAAPAPSPLADFSQQLTMSEEAALSQQLARCWSIQAGARYAEDMVVEVRLTVSTDRRVTSATVVDQWRYNQDSFFKAAADSAIRAVNSPQCETLQLPPEKYESWKDIVVTFDPRDML